VQQALANLERDQAQLENARVQERRYKTLVEKELVAREQYDQFRTNLSALEATVSADRAAVENAKAAALAGQAGVENARAVIRADEAMVQTARLNLGYTTIRAPMEGRTGNLMLQAGNVVKGNDDNPMVVIAQVHPIYVSFAVPQQYLAAIKQHQAAGPLTVRAIPTGAPKPATGRLTFVNNTVDPSTATIQLKGTFDNAENTLWPGQYVEVVLTLTTETAVVVPSQAIQPGQQGPYVFVVKPDLTVQPAGRARPPPRHGDDRHPRRGPRRARRHRRPASSRAGLARGDQAAQGVVSPCEHRALHPPSRPHHAPDGGDPDLRRDGLPETAGERPAQRRLPHDPGCRQPAGREPGDDGLRGGHAARAAVHHHRRHRLDDVTSALGVTQITIQFTLDRNIDAAGQDVQASIHQGLAAPAAGHADAAVLPEVNPADQPVLYMALSSPTQPLYTVDEYAQTFLAQRISTVAASRR